MSNDWLVARRGLGYEAASEPNRYMTAEVCPNGHPTTDDVEGSPETTAKFCSTCGSATIRACPNCNAPIRGAYRVPGVYGDFGYAPPNHCYGCGAPFPWTKAKLDAAKEHAAELEGLDANERTQLQAAIDDLASGGARTELGASRFRRLATKAGIAVGSGLYKIVLDVASEAAKKSLTGG